MDTEDHELTQIKTHPYDRELTRIKSFLKGSSKGYTVTEISRSIDINRNSVAKYLDVLCISGAVELKVIGSAKIYTLTKRIPISSILSLSSDYLIVLDDEFVVTYVNEKVLNFENKTPEDIVGRSVESAGFKLLSIPDIDKILQECTLGKDIFKEIEVDNNGKTWYFRAKFVPSILENGKRGILAILDDISEIKQYQRDLEKTVIDRTKELSHTSTSLKKEIKSHREVKDAFEDSERKYQTLIELAEEGVWTFDAEGNTTFVNRKMSEILGYSIDEMLGKSILTFSSANDRVYLEERLHQIKTGNNEHFELMLLKKDTTPAYTRLSASPRIDEKGTFIYGLFLVSDISALKKADEALVESELHYRTIIETSPNGILVLDLEGIIRLGNIQGATMLGYKSTGELTGKNFFDYVTPNDLQSSKAHLQKTLEKGFTKYLECRLISKDSTAFCAEVSISTIPDHTGRPSGFVCVLSDVTERRKAEYLVRKSEEKHRALVEGISHIIFTTDSKGRFTYVSPVIHQVLGYSSAELMGKYIYTLVPSEERHILGEKLKEAQEGKTSPNDFKMMDKTGTIRWGRIIAQPLIEGEKITGITGLIGDITDLKHSEQALQESEEKLKLAIEGSGVGLWDWRVQAGEMVINDRWARIIGYTMQELGPLTIDLWQSLIHPDDLQKFKDLLEKHFAGETPDFECESRMQHKEGHWVWVLDRGMVTERDKDKKPVRMTGTHLNISERKAAEEALRQANKKLNLLSSLTRHDILNKVSVLLGYLDRAKSLAQDPTLLEYLNRLETSTKAIGKLVKFTRDYKDLGMNPPQWFALTDCVNEVTEWINPHSIRLSVDVGEWEIYADSQVSRVFRSIFENAGVHGKNVTEIFVECIKDDRGLTVIIGDNGIGIPEELKKEIFEPGMMRNRGLSLFLAKEILSITGLIIEERGEPGKGARFEIHVPLGCFRIPHMNSDGKHKQTPVVETAP
ncbi:MAG: PAS domain S-box protein [Methanoregula sp.]|jgi:PAS domain S-box-containing protein|nr:PAS domain S-box protein [Methanoregula sp.]